MIRRNARLRREYLYRKSLEGKEREDYEKKRKIRKALGAGKSIPTELREEAEDVRIAADWEDERTAVLPAHEDDEYARAGITDPKILVTTSRDPSSSLKEFVKELRFVFPNSQRMNRGSATTKSLIDACRSADVTDLVLVHEHSGKPDGLIVCHLPFGPTAYFGLRDAVTRHEIQAPGKMSTEYPHLVFDAFSTKLGQRTKNILKYLFPVPKPASQRTVSFVNKDDFISFRHHVFRRVGKEVELAEIGPRFEMRLYQIKLGTIDQPEAETEWALRPYMNTAKKRKAL